MEGKTSSFMHIEIFDTHIINIQEVLIRRHKWVLTDKMCTYCSIDKQYVKGVQKQ